MYIGKTHHAGVQHMGSGGYSRMAVCGAGYLTIITGDPPSSHSAVEQNVNCANCRRTFAFQSAVSGKRWDHREEWVPDPEDEIPTRPPEEEVEVEKPHTLRYVFAVTVEVGVDEPQSMQDAIDDLQQYDWEIVKVEVV